MGCVLSSLAVPLNALAEGEGTNLYDLSDRATRLEEESHPNGHPEVHLDSLTFPRDIVGAKDFERHLLKVLKREAYSADWGAGTNNQIEYRFNVTELRFTVSDGTMHVYCAAEGTLPSRKRAKSELSFGGHLSERTELTKRVLEIVARGVITRLAELERIRRGLR